MKKLLVFFLTIITSIACTNRSVPPPSMGNELNGTWKLTKISLGYPPAFPMEEPKLPYEETLEFDISHGKYRRIQNNKLVEESKIIISKNEKSIPNQLVVSYLSDSTYQSYSVKVLDGKTFLYLYQKCPIGAVLADGSLFTYEKLQIYAL